MTVEARPTFLRKEESSNFVVHFRYVSRLRSPSWLLDSKSCWKGCWSWEKSRCWFETLGVLPVNSETPLVGRSGRAGRKRRAMLAGGRFNKRGNFHRRLVLGAARGENVHTCPPSLKGVSRGLDWFQSRIRSTWSQQHITLRRILANGPGGGNRGQKEHLQGRGRARSLLLPASPLTVHRGHSLSLTSSNSRWNTLSEVQQNHWSA